MCRWGIYQAKSIHSQHQSRAHLDEWLTRFVPQSDRLDGPILVQIAKLCSVAMWRVPAYFLASKGIITQILEVHALPLVESLMPNLVEYLDGRVSW